MFIRSPYNYDRDEASLASGLVCTSESLADQSAKDECDINEIVRRFGVGYQMPEGLRMPQYGDFSNISSYHEACNAIAQAGESFDLLPAAVRDRFNNDPGKFVDFVLDDKNRDAAIELGLIPKDKPPQPATLDDVRSAIAALAPVRPEPGPAGGTD